MSAPQRPFVITVAGSSDFTRRMAVACRRPDLGLGTTLDLALGTLAELRALSLEQRPDMLVFEIGFRSTDEEIHWLRSMLEQVRERLGRTVRIVAAVTSAERFAMAGSLLFRSGAGIAPSGLVDDLLITPPAGAPLGQALEEQLLNALSYYVELLRESGEQSLTLPSLYDDNWVPAMCDAASRDIWLRWLPRYARYINENPLILGPSGSGKTRLAAALHHLSGRKGPFVSITPRDFSSPELVQAELFGAVSGAYTGAVDKWGLVARAERGTLFIDELQSIDRDLQGKLITFIENKTYRRVGEAESHQADVRFIFASNRSLQDLVESGALRDDFGYRLERLLLTLPPLHERRLDIAAGICFALGKVLQERARPEAGAENASQFDVTGLSPEAYRLLCAAPWPGNLRQLENSIAKLIEIADIRGHSLIESDAVQEVLASSLGHRPLQLSEIVSRGMRRLVSRAESETETSLDRITNLLREEIRLAALDATGGDVTLASELLKDSVHALECFAESHLLDYVGPARFQEQDHRRGDNR